MYIILYIFTHTYIYNIYIYILYLHTHIYIIYIYIYYIYIYIYYIYIYYIYGENVWGIFLRLVVMDSLECHEVRPRAAFGDFKLSVLDCSSVKKPKGRSILRGGLEHFLFFHSVGNGIIIPTVAHSIIFQRGRLAPTKQLDTLESTYTKFHGSIDVRHIFVAHMDIASMQKHLRKPHPLVT